jgi:hypothetical protein
MHKYDVLIGTGKNAQQVADALGLPASSYAGSGFRGFQALSIQPQPGRIATAYESTVAPVQQGAYQATGGLRQLIVLNAKDFTAPKPIPGGFIPVAGGALKCGTISTNTCALQRRTLRRS